MQITLRKLSKLIQRVDSELHDIRRDALYTTKFEAFVYDDVNNIYKSLQEAREEYSELTGRVIELIQVRTALRNLLGVANHENGVNDIVTKLAGLNVELQFIQELRKNAGKKVRLTIPEIEARLEAKKNTASGAQVTVRTFGDTGKANDTISLNVLEEEDLDRLEATEKSIKVGIDNYVEILERINRVVEVPIPLETLERVEQLNIII